jgi:serine phosphatase RsbU (regulator of sigma subunit)
MNHLRRSHFFVVVILLISIFQLTGKTMLGQTTQLDSLLNVLKTQQEDTAKINTLNEISRAYLYQLNDMLKLSEYATKTLTLSRRLNYKKGIANAYLYTGIFYWSKSNYKVALYYYQKALVLMKELGNKKGENSCYINIGQVYAEQGNYKDAIASMQRGIKIAEEIKDKKGIGKGYNNLANIYLFQGNDTMALTYYLKVLKIWEEINDKASMAVCYNNMGVIFYQENKMEEALMYYKRAAAIQEERNDKRSLGSSYNNIGSIYEDKNQYSAALNYQLKALKVREEVGDVQGMIKSYSSIGDNYLKQKKVDLGLMYQLKSYELCKKTGYKKGLVNASGGVGSLYEEKKQYATAISYYEQMLRIAKDLDLKEGMASAYEKYTLVYKKTGDYEKALKYMGLFNALKDSLLNKENFKQISELNTRYETDKKEKEILLLTKDQELNEKIIKQQKLVRWGLIIGLLLLFVSVFSIYRRYHFKQKANILLEEQKKKIQEQNVLITDSIDYAKTIQEVVLPTEKMINNLFPEHFILYKPKSIVSGDFYWMHKVGRKRICAVADCTGHGVPGAFMSLLAYNMLENVVKKQAVLKPASILDDLNREVVNRLSLNGEQETVKHGMDISLIIIDEQENVLHFAGAHNSLYLVRNNQLIELKADKMSIGFVSPTGYSFYTDQNVALQKGDLIYLFTDGFPDQIGGPSRKKFYYPPFRTLLSTISSLDMDEQQRQLNEAHEQWLAGKYEQTDDILIMGIRY